MPKTNADRPRTVVFTQGSEATIVAVAGQVRAQWSCSAATGAWVRLVLITLVLQEAQVFAVPAVPSEEVMHMPAQMTRTFR